MSSRQQIEDLNANHEAGHAVLHVHFGFQTDGLTWYATGDAALDAGPEPEEDPETVYKFLVIRRAAFYSQGFSSNRNPQDLMKAVKSDDDQQAFIAALLYKHLAGEKADKPAANDFVNAALDLVNNETHALVSNKAVACSVKRVRAYLLKNNAIPKGASERKLEAETLVPLVNTSIKACTEKYGVFPELVHLAEFLELCNAI